MEDTKIKEFQCDEIECVEGEEGDLGQGSFGTVKLGFYKYKAVAIKCIHHQGNNREKQKRLNKFKQEITNCQKSRHDNVVHIFGIAKWPYSIAIVMEYLPVGKLADFIVDEDIVIGYFLRLRFCREIASGLDHLHNLEPKEITHGDLKAENVLLNEDLHCKIADFGSSVVSPYTSKTSIESELQKPEYTAIYAAPELLANPATERTPALDIYSFSIIIYMVLKRKLPLVHNAESCFLENIKKGMRPSFSSNDPPNCLNDQELAVVNLLEEITKRCWSHNSSDRPSIGEVLQRLHQFAVNIDAYIMVKEVATALEGMNIVDKARNRYQCSPLNMFHPPLFQLQRPENQGTSQLSMTNITETLPDGLKNAANDQSTSASSSHKSKSTTALKFSGGFLALNKRKLFHVDVKTFDVEPFPDLKYNHSVGSLSKLGNHVFAIGGYCQFNAEKLDLNNPLRWEDICLTSMPRCVSAALNGHIYATGGKWWTEYPTSSGEKYCPTSPEKENGDQADEARWLAIKEMKHERSRHALVSLEDSLYAVGGKDLSSAEQYDPTRDEWFEIAAMATVRERHQVVAIDGSIYAIGGSDGLNKLTSVERYDPRMNKWSTLKAVIEPRFLFGACAIEKNIYVAGGLDNPIVEVFDPVSDQVIDTHSLYECEGVHYILAA